MALPVRREGETLTVLLERLDNAIRGCYDNDEFVDETNGVQRAACGQGWMTRGLPCEPRRRHRTATVMVRQPAI